MRNILFLAAAITLMGCDPDRIYENNIEFSEGVWHIDSIPVFQFEIPQAGQYDVYMNVRNTSLYPYRNLYVTYYLEDTTGQLIRSNLENIQLFDAKTGAPYGDGGIGDIFGHQRLLLDDYQLEEMTYRLRVEHYMRKDSLQDILAVGVRVEKNNGTE